MDILKNFGVDPILLAAQIVNFLIILWILKKFAYSPIFSMLQKRKKLVAEGLANAQKSEEILQKAIEEEKEVLKKAHSQAQELITDAKRQAQEMLFNAEENTKVRVEKILEDAKKEIERQTQDAEKALAKSTTELAVKLLEKSLPDIIDSKTQKEIVSKVAKKLTK